MNKHHPTCPKYLHPNAELCICGGTEEAIGYIKPIIPESADKFKIIIDTKIDGKDIISEVTSEGMGYRNRMYTDVLRTQEQGVKDALKKLGWMSPEDAKIVLNALREIADEEPTHGTVCLIETAREAISRIGNVKGAA